MRGHRVAGLLGLLALAACGKQRATAIVVGVSVEPRVPEQLDELSISISRGDALKFSNTYALPSSEAPLPGTITAEAADGGDGDPILFVVRARSTKTGQSVERRARVRPTHEETKLLRIRLQYACLDRVCEPGSTCVDGACVGEMVDASGLPPFESNEAAAAPSGCFDEAACLVGATPQTLAGCSFQVTQAKGSYNVAATFQGSSAPVVLEPGMAYAVSGQTITLAPNVCSAPNLVAVSLATACPAKNAPVCARPPSINTGGAGGAGGSANAGKAGAAGIAGAGAGGVAGKAGAAGVGGGGVGGAGVGGVGGAGVGGAGGAGVGGVGGAGVGGVGGAGVGGAGGAGAGGAGVGGVGGGGVGGMAGAGGQGGAALLSTPKEGFRVLDAGFGGVCVVKTNGDLYCWGLDHYGKKFFPQGSPGGLEDVVVPIKIPLVPPLAAVTVGESHLCGLTPTGGVVCWGANWGGQLGRADASLDPGQVSLGAKAIDLRSVERDGTCALLETGEVYCWGEDTGWGELGQGGANTPILPTKVALPPSDPIVQLSGSGPICALSLAGDVSCWGRGVLVPTKVASLAEEVVVQLGTAVFVRTAAGITQYTLPGLSAGVAVPYPSVADGMVSRLDGLCVHDASAMKLLCSTSPTNPGSFTHDPGILGAKPLAASGWASAFYAPGGGVTCARVPSGEVRCWGDDFRGMIGVGRPEDRHTPTPVPGVTLKSLSGDGHRMTGISSTSELVRWGMLADYTPLVPTPTVTASAGGWAHVRAGTTYDALFPANGAPSMILPSSTGLAQPGRWLHQQGPGFVDVFSSYHFAIGVAGSTLWGYSDDGASQVEFGNPTHSWVAGETTSVALPETMTALVMGNVGACAIGASGKLHCWGCNANCSQRFGPGPDLATPQEVSTPNDQTAGSLCMGYDYLCVRTQMGVVGCRGRNDSGNLGDGSTVSSDSYKIVSMPSAAGVACGPEFACAWTMGGDVYCWGRDYVGELGVGPVPGGIQGPTSLKLMNVAEVSLGFNFACARQEPGGNVLCWGLNTYGQLGIGVTGQYPVGQVVTGLPAGL